MEGRYEFVAPCHFGLEVVSKREISDLGYEIVRVEDGKVTFTGDVEALVRANIFLRTTQRILWKVAEFRAVTFEELFQGIKNIPWEEYLPKDARFWVTKATSVKSALFSTSDIQSIAKKAMVERMKEHYHISWFAESGQEYPVRISIYKDMVTVGLDTSGESLHKRGYRKMVSKAPIEETLAAALIKLTPWNKDRILVDPFCGSGTLMIEAAMKAMNMAPGLRRRFTAEHYAFLPAAVWKEQREKALSEIRRGVEFQGVGFDIDPAAVALAAANAKLAGVEKHCRFFTADVKDFSPAPGAMVFTNPPYGERLGDLAAAAELERMLGRRLEENPVRSAYIITADADFEQHFGKKAKRRRKLYNGMIPCQVYMYF